MLPKNVTMNAEGKHSSLSRKNIGDEELLR